jgi:hypothetical protein
MLRPLNQSLQGTLTRSVENVEKSRIIPFSLLVSAPDLNRYLLEN